MIVNFPMTQLKMICYGPVSSWLLPFSISDPKWNQEFFLYSFLKFCHNSEQCLFVFSLNQVAATFLLNTQKNEWHFLLWDIIKVSQLKNGDGWYAATWCPTSISRYTPATVWCSTLGGLPNTSNASNGSNGNGSPAPYGSNGSHGSKGSIGIDGPDGPNSSHGWNGTRGCLPTPAGWSAYNGWRLLHTTPSKGLPATTRS